MVVNFSRPVAVHRTSVDVKKLKQTLNAFRTALEANGIPGALTPLDLAEEQLSDGSNMTSIGNMTNTPATVEREVISYLVMEERIRY
jgi:hypothetical protein